MKKHLSRRAALGMLAGIGITSQTLVRSLAVEIEQGTLDAEGLARAQWISGVQLSSEQRDALVTAVQGHQTQLQSLRAFPLDADTPPALQFLPWHSGTSGGSKPRPAQTQRRVRPRKVDRRNNPSNDVELAFASIGVLGSMLRERKISSLELTNLCLDRLSHFQPQLNCVVTLTPELAIRLAKEADRELAAGCDRGPLHGIPWGAKDLIAVEGYPTTWGAEIYRGQVRPTTATVARRLEAAGSVLVAKLTLGAFAMGDQWFGGMTKNPWNLEQGSSGSSAGSAAATVAGLVPFAIGSETLGSIISPSRRCAATGLRPTFGRVSRAGCMPLAWSFDKLGPMARSIEDCALVFGAIHGADGRDPTAVTRPFSWPKKLELKNLRVGYTGSREGREELAICERLGMELIAVELPRDLPLDALDLMIDVESASMFYDVWKDGNEDGLFRWGKIWQAASFIPAIDYVRAARIRRILMEQMEDVMEKIDVLIAAEDLLITNLTGHPSVVMPLSTQSAKLREEGRNDVDANAADTAQDATTQKPPMVTITGQLFDEARLLTVAEALQRESGDQPSRPPAFYRSHRAQP